MIACKYNALFQDLQPIEFTKPVGRNTPREPDPKHIFCPILSKSQSIRGSRQNPAKPMNGTFGKAENFFHKFAEPIKRID
jgi:hypothetical protein